MAHIIGCQREQLQKNSMEIIFDQVKATGKGNIDDFKALAKSFIEESSLDYIILGCTEYSYFSKNHELPNIFVEAMEVVTRVAIEKSGYKYKDGEINIDNNVQTMA